MQRSTLFLGLVAAAVSMQAQEAPVAKWAQLMGGTNGDQSTAVVVGNDEVLWLGTAATTEAAPEVYYAGQEICQGALYNAGNSANNNLSLICTDQSGLLKWNIYSTSGDYASGQGNIAVDGEGNVIFSAKVRHTDGMLDQPINMIDATGKVFEYGGSTEKRFNRLAVVKADSQGAIQWIKLMDVSTAPAACASGNNADFTGDAITSTALTVDTKGNIYIGGNYCAPLTIDGVTMHPENVSTWTGDSQTACGNMFLIKLDGDGSYVASAIGIGDINGVSSVQALEHDGDDIYVYGYAKGNGSFSFCDTALTPSEIPSPIVGCLDTDLKAKWLKCMPCEMVEGKTALQNVGMSLCGDNLWLCGMFNQKIIDSTDPSKYIEATQGKLREGFVINLDKNTGEWLAAADSRADYPDVTKLTGYLKAVQNPESPTSVYVYGYVMDANIGIFLREYDATSLVAKNSWSIATGGGVPTAVALAYDTKNNCAYITGRGNKAFTLDDITTEATKGWDVLMAGIQMPARHTTSITDITVESDNQLYDLTGRRVTGRPATGLYISKGKKIMVR